MVKDLVYEVGVDAAAAAAAAVDDGYEDNNELFCETMEQGKYEVRMIYYLQCPQPELVLLISPHVDLSAVTLLVERRVVPGLQLLKDGQRFFVHPLDGAILVNVGAIMQVHTWLHTYQFYVPTD